MSNMSYHQFFIKSRLKHLFLKGRFVLSSIPSGSGWHYVNNGSHHKGAFFLFLSELQLSRKKVPCTFCLAKCIKKGKKMFLLTTRRMALTTKRAIVLFLSECHLQKRTSFVLFALPNASQKDKKNVPFDMKNGSRHKKSIFFVPF